MTINPSANSRSTLHNSGASQPFRRHEHKRRPLPSWLKAGVFRWRDGIRKANPAVDATYLAKAFDLNPAHILDLMAACKITSRFETGVDTDAGTYRLAFWHDDIQVRYTCDADAIVVKTSRIKSKPRL